MVKEITEHVMHYYYKGFRIDDRRKGPFGCFKVRHRGGSSYLAVDFKSLAAAKRFLDKAATN